MPLVDMSPEKLKTYEGRSPRPGDFDAYWDQTLRELDETDPAPELIPAEFQTPETECFHLYFTGLGGARIHAKYLRPKCAKTSRPAVLTFHGYSGDSGDWQGKLAFVSAGFSVAALDVRGQGGLSEDNLQTPGGTMYGHVIKGLDGGRDKLFYRGVFADTAQLARVVMSFDEVDETRVGALGGSQGGALTVACAALEPRIRRIAPAIPFLSDYKRVWEMDLAQGAYIGIKDYFRRFDPEHKREDEVFTTLGYIDIQNLAPRIKAEVLWGIGLMDTTCPPSTQFAAYNKITAPKEMVIYPDYGHETHWNFHDKAFMFLAKL
ncbi:MAG: acetylxylan esterase [Oscillospiraceae bacterium]|jgi:cephalosporin-C deacetylase|nr:acetylxylan esterase [Oscillospiraceae bacterium]